MIGLATGERGMTMMAPVIDDPFAGILAVFLLDMGLLVGRRLRDFGAVGWPVLAFGVHMPLLGAGIGLLAASALGLSEGVEMIEQAGATGYTVVADVSGKGVRGIRDDAHLSDVFRNRLIVVIASDEIAMRIVDASQPLLDNYAGIVLVSDVWVVRNEHF